MNALQTPFDAIPRDARVFALRSRSKIPQQGTKAHLDAMPCDRFVYLGGNYGIALDSQFLLVDIDHDDPDWLSKLPLTWTQRTPGGVHRLFRVPPGFRGHNHKIKVGTNGSAKTLGDLKVHGYLVGPGSEVDPARGRPGGIYTLLDARDPVPAPEWLLALAASAPNTADDKHALAYERERIIVGENDDTLTALAGAYRRQGFSASAMANLLWSVVCSPIFDQDPSAPPYTPQDCVRIACSAAKWEPGSPELLLAEPNFLCATQVHLVGAPVRWWVRGFFPRGEPTMMFGRGGVGKSSIGSWLAAETTKAGGTFAFIGVEEPHERFMARAVMGGGVRSRIHAITEAEKIMLPKGLPVLMRQIQDYGGVDVLYFDSIYSHFDAVPGLNAAERARRCLAPLAAFSNKTGTAVVAVFHENKAGDYLGSVEMVNVARHVLKATRIPGRELRLDVFKTNLPSGQPDFALRLNATLTDYTIDNESQLEEQEDGTYAVMRMHVLSRGDDIRLDEVSIDDVAELPGEKKKARHNAQVLENTGVV